MNNQDMLNKYLLERAANGIDEKTRFIDENAVKKVTEFLNKPFKEITKEDMVRFVADLNSRDYKPSYVHVLKYKIRQFFNWLYDLEPRTYPDCVRWMRSYNPRSSSKSGGLALPVKPKDILTEQDILRLVDAATHPRDQALVILTWEAAARSREILDLKIGSVQLHGETGHVTLEGSTGARQLLIHLSVPYLETWLNVHPLKHNPGAYLFPPLKGKSKGQRMEGHNFLKILRRLRRDAKIQKPVRPHLLRHARLTLLAKHLPDAQLKNYAGWTQSSRMTGVYVHLAGKDLDQPILEMYGLADKEKPAETPLKEKVCVRGHKNKPTAVYCDTCGIILDREKALKLQKEGMFKDEEIEGLKKQLSELQPVADLRNLILQRLKDGSLALFFKGTNKNEVAAELVPLLDPEVKPTTVKEAIVKLDKLKKNRQNQSDS